METKKQPIKRHPVLQPFSRQHHFGLLFSWKLRKGLSKNIEMDRLLAFSKWFFENEIEPHFADEEKYLFPILPKGNELVERALKEHRRIKRLFADESDPERSLHRLEEELDAHIRFEERVLFNEIQMVATKEELDKIEQLHKKIKYKDYHDPFWED